MPRQAAMLPERPAESPLTGPITPKAPPNAPEGLESRLRAILQNPVVFSRATLPVFALREYQAGVSLALSAAAAGSGLNLAAVFSRQSGKDELIAQWLAWWMIRNQRRGGSIVMAAPTLRPQAMITRDRLVNRLELSPLGRGYWRDGVKVGMGQAQVGFASAGPDANARGLTASTLLIGNEAQDIDIERWDAVFAPMTASTNASTVIFGTEFDGTGLLAREVDYLRTLQHRDGRQRVFLVPWDQVAAEVPAYGLHYRSRVDQLGEEHPFIRTEYHLERLEEGAGLFPADRCERMQGAHPRRVCAIDGRTYAMTLDVAGEDEVTRLAGGEWNPEASRDAVVLTVFEVDVPRSKLQLPVYKVVNRKAWTGIGHVALATEIERQARSTWGARALAIDATGVGAGLAAVLKDKLEKGPKKCLVYPVIFGPAVKSKLGWDFVGLVDSGRFQDYYEPKPEKDTAEHWRQVRRCIYEVRPGPGKLLSWGARPGEHDDFLLSAALVAILDEHDWRSRVARGTMPD